MGWALQRLMRVGALNSGGARDATAPTCVLTSAAETYVFEAFSVTVTFSEAVTGFDAAADVTVGNGTAGDPVDSGDGIVYTVTVTPTAIGAVTVDVAAGVCEDAAGNENTAATQLTCIAVIGMALWLDASDASTLFQDSAGTIPAASDNDVIGLWKDKTTYARHATQTTTGSKPLLKTALFGVRSAVKADGADDLMDFTSFGTTTAYTLYIVAAPNTINNSVEYILATSTMGFHFGGATGAILGYGIYDATNNTMAAEEPTGLSIYTYNPLALFRNGVEATYNAQAAAGAITITKLFQREPINLKSDASIGELVLFVGVHSVAQRAVVLTYLNGKWAVY